MGVAVALVALAARDGWAQGDDAVPVSDGDGRLVVLALLLGEPPPPVPALEIDATTGCHGAHPVSLEDRSLRLDDAGGIADVVVTIEVEGARPEVPSEPYVLDQRGCRFEPHVLVVPAGARVRFDNSDDVTHNVHTHSRRNAPMNRAMVADSDQIVTFERAETFRIGCDMHPWMKSWMVVTDAAWFGVTATDGAFTFDALPPGTYRVRWWHERLLAGTSAPVTVVAGRTARLDLALEVPQDKPPKRRKKR